MKLTLTLTAIALATTSEFMAGGIKTIEFLKWGNPNQSVVDGDCVPPGKVWLIRHSGIAYAAVIPYAATEWDPVDWMMQIKHYLPNGGFHLIPIWRPLTKTVSTPVLATEGRFIMIAGEALQARANWIREDKMMALLYLGWEFDDGMLPYLLGIGSQMPQTEVQQLESQLQKLRSL